MSLWVVPACLEYCSLIDGNARLSVIFSNGRRARIEGAEARIYALETILLEALAECAAVDVHRWPEMQMVERRHRGRSARLA